MDVPELCTTRKVNICKNQLMYSFSDPVEGYNLYTCGFMFSLIYSVFGLKKNAGPIYFYPPSFDK